MIEFRISPEAFIATKIGLKTFDPNSLHENFDALMQALISKKPETVKGRYFMKGMIKTSMGPILRLDLSHYAKIVASQGI